MTGPDDLIRRGDVLRIFEPETSMVRRRICDDVRAIPSVSIAAPSEVQAERDAALAGAVKVKPLAEPMRFSAAIHWRGHDDAWLVFAAQKDGEWFRWADYEIIIASIQPDTEAVEMAEAAAFSAGYEAGQRDEREACAVLASVRADSLDDAIKWGGGKVYLASLKGGLIELRNLAKTIRQRGERGKQ